ncbi:DUF858 domain-containing protein [Colletotrichum plurivorum]|uniref:Alpha N-terminal protein methyltransferase 1 n=1 Tax=Colletotrichum plurivorum TaxID=2175906 RepID=A0A8H6NM61_9PEZI|nr:DUF858 domain-containing protein [Colletotrichum plurivorum]
MTGEEGAAAAAAAASSSTSTATTPPPDAKINAADGRFYWQGVDADVNGMLGGFPYISKVDLQGSRNFLAKLGVGTKSGLRTVSRALEGGAGNSARAGRANVLPRLTHCSVPCILSSLYLVSSGNLSPVPPYIRPLSLSPPTQGSEPCRAPADPQPFPSIGRITEGLLLDVAEQVDIVEPIAKFTAALQEKSGVGSVFNIGLEEWKPLDGTSYDLVWNQWCLGHLTDDQLVAYLRRCKEVVAPTDGFIVVKENLSTNGADLFDDVDSSVTRVDEKFRLLFEQAGLRLIKTELQRGFPKELFPVRMYALK